MELRILESSLNLRVDRRNDARLSNTDYQLKKEVAREQLAYKDVDLYCNVEYMECQDEEYLYEFSKGYKRISALFGKDNRGILCYVKKELGITVVHRKEYPHFLHFRITKNNETADVIVFRILVSDSSKEDFEDRAKQWNIVMEYIDSNIKETSRLILTGDWNHARVRSQYAGYNQESFHYQKIKNDLKIRGLSMGINLKPGHKEHSYAGYLAIDHIAVGDAFSYLEAPGYSHYHPNAPIGTPDHAYLLACIRS